MNGESLLAGVHRVFDRMFSTPEVHEAVDSKVVTRTVAHYAMQIGCDLSNAAAAQSWALRNGTHTLDAIRKGKQRARVLYARQCQVAPEPERA